VSYGAAVGQQHYQPVDTYTEASGRRKSVFKCGDVILIHHICFIVALLALFDLLDKPFLLVDRVVELRKRIAELAPCDEYLKALGKVGIVRVTLCQRRYLYRVLIDKRRLNELLLNLFFKCK